MTKLKNIFIIDSDIPRSYDTCDLLEGKFGGTIAAIIGLYKALSINNHVYIVKSTNNKTLSHAIINEDEFLYSKNINPDVIIHVRSSDRTRISNLRKRFKVASIIHWQHTTFLVHRKMSTYLSYEKRSANNHIKNLLSECADNQVKIIGTSRFHCKNISAAARTLTPKKIIDIDWAYNPVLTLETRSPSQKYDPDLFVFASNPDRGLKPTLALFTAIRERWPTARLLVTSPNYAENTTAINYPGVEFLGSLSRKNLWDLLDNAFSVLYVNTAQAECFGYVFAEANALGCPVLTTDRGAAKEVLGGAEQIISVSNTEDTLKKIAEWRKGRRPVVSVNPDCITSAVASKWEHFY